MDGAGLPLAAAVVVARSPAQATQTITDAAGRFAFVSLSPGTYTVTISRAGYMSVAYPGIAIRADYQSTLVAMLPLQLRSIGTIHDGTSLYRVGGPGQPADVYKLPSHFTPFYDFGDQGANPLRFVPGVQLGSGLVLAN